MRANRDKIKAMHFCPHCNGALSEAGEELVIQRRIREEKASQMLKDVEQESWFLKNCSLIMTLTSILVFISSYIFFLQRIHAAQSSENAMPLGLSLFLVVVNLLILDVAQIITKYQKKKEFKHKHPSDAEVLRI